LAKELARKIKELARKIKDWYANGIEGWFLCTDEEES